MASNTAMASLVIDDGAKTSEPWRRAMTACCTSCWKRRRLLIFAGILMSTTLYSTAYVAPQSFFPRSVGIKQYNYTPIQLYCKLSLQVEARGISIYVYGFLVWVSPTFASIGPIVVGCIVSIMSIIFCFLYSYEL